MNVIMNVIRTVLSWVIQLIDRLTRPEPIQRSPDEQEAIEKELESMALYQFEGCPFCVKVRRTAHKLNLPLEYRDARNDSKHRSELKEQGGKIQVPCLRIDHGDRVEWMYESDDIIDYLEKRFG